MPKKRTKSRFSTTLEQGRVGEAFSDLFPNELSRATADNIVAQVADAGTTEVQVVGRTIPGNFLQAGDTYRIRAQARITTDAGPGTSTFRIRFGPTTLTGSVLVSLAPTEAGGATNEPVTIDGILTVRTVGATGTISASMFRVNPAALFTALTGVDMTASTTVDTTVDNILEFTYQTSDAGTDARWEIGSLVGPIP